MEYLKTLSKRGRKFINSFALVAETRGGTAEAPVLKTCALGQSSGPELRNGAET